MRRVQLRFVVALLLLIAWLNWLFNLTQLTSSIGEVSAPTLEAAPVETVWVLSREGEDCWTACKRQETRRSGAVECRQEEFSANGLHTLCGRFKFKVKVNCTVGYGDDLPAVRRFNNKEVLFLPEPEIGRAGSVEMSCSGGYAQSKRTCPCVERTRKRSRGPLLLSSNREQGEVGLALTVKFDGETWPRLAQLRSFAFMEKGALFVREVRRGRVDGKFFATLFATRPGILRFSRVIHARPQSNPGGKFHCFAKSGDGGMPVRVVRGERSRFFVDIGSKYNQYLTVHLVNGKMGLRIPAVVSVVVEKEESFLLEVAFTVEDRKVKDLKVDMRYLGFPVCSATCPCRDTVVTVVDTGLREEMGSCGRDVLAKGYGRWLGDKWKTEGCAAKKVGASITKECLAGKGVVFSGDSKMLEQFNQVVELLGGRVVNEGVVSMEASTGDAKLWYLRRESVYVDSLDAKLESIFGETRNKVSDVGVIIMSPVLSDYRSYFRGVEAFAQTFAADVDQVMQRFPVAKVFVQMMPALHPSMSSWKWRIMNSWEQQALMRSALVEALGIMKPKVSIVDPFYISYGRREIDTEVRQDGFLDRVDEPENANNAILDATVEQLLGVVCG